MYCLSGLVSSTDTCISAKFIPPSWEDMFQKKSGSLKCIATGEEGFKKMEIKASGHPISTSSDKNLAYKKTVELEAIINFEEWSNGTKFMCTIEHELTAEPTEIMYTREKGNVFLIFEYVCFFLFFSILTTTYALIIYLS